MTDQTETLILGLTIGFAVGVFTVGVVFAIRTHIRTMNEFDEKYYKLRDSIINDLENL